MANLNIKKLSDAFGQYEIVLKCECGHMRQCHPHTLAAFAGWEALLDNVVKRMRCTKCGKRKCTARTIKDTAPRGYKSH